MTYLADGAIKKMLFLMMNASRKIAEDFKNFKKEKTKFKLNNSLF